ncbi:MAG: anti-sigma factor [Bacillaceae bacterium]|nr:anti-sigma factor [Bacillaceae bacterium]
MVDCRFFQKYMHQYFDGELNPREKKLLNEHMRECGACDRHFHQLEKTLALLQSASHVQVPDNFTQSVMAQLPDNKEKRNWKSFFKKHPFLVAVSLFILLMSGSLFSVWNGGEQDFQLTASHPEKLRIDKENGVVIVPEDTVVEGDIVVRHGSIQVEGEVKGNVVAIEGDVFLASTAAVSGQAEEIDQILEWVWYHIKKMIPF